MRYEFCIIGGGIVGLAAARALSRRHPGAGILVLEKEAGFAVHQTGHNSGVIHAGLYYKPGSLKAVLCKQGADATRAFCEQHAIPYETRGKLVVATSEFERGRMDRLAETARENGISIELLDAQELRRREPNVAGIGAILSPMSGIVDYRRICQAIASELREAGAVLRTGVRVTRIRESGNEVEIVGNVGGPGAGRDSESWGCSRLIVCAGLQSDRLAREAGLAIQHRIVPFRGEYYAIRAEKRAIVHHMIYPVPDPALPFLGIHLTPMIDGRLTVGPNAVLGMAREGYPRLSVAPRDLADTLAFPGFWKLARRDWRSGLSELGRSLSRRRYLAECRRYAPGLELADLTPMPAGIRAQAVLRDGSMVQDFLFLQTPRMLHVCNAPSPAATSALPIGEMIADRATAA
ncbi:L-2-hydroxyglutarate oxidase [Lichenicoccus sp.]|uniref:L-2-hydroxyglutarate oxidase n=1 Tax=Lichenicoccus sp. TaxID=2781899 RepID=UPI003D100714